MIEYTILHLKKKKNNIMRGHKGFVIGGIIMELTDIKSICAFIEDAESDREIAYYVGIYQKALEALQNILIAKKSRKISDKDLYKVFKTCLKDDSWCARIEIREESYSQYIEVSTFLPLELVEFLIDNAKNSKNRAFCFCYV